MRQVNPLINTNTPLKNASFRIYNSKSVPRPGRKPVTCWLYSHILWLTPIHRFGLSIAVLHFHLLVSSLAIREGASETIRVTVATVAGIESLTMGINLRTA